MPNTCPTHAQHMPNTYAKTAQPAQMAQTAQVAHMAQMAENTQTTQTTMCRLGGYSFLTESPLLNQHRVPPDLSFRIEEN